MSSVIPRTRLYRDPLTGRIAVPLEVSGNSQQNTIVRYFPYKTDGDFSTSKVYSTTYVEFLSTFSEEIALSKGSTPQNVLTFFDNTPLQFSDGTYLELAS